MPKGIYKRTIEHCENIAKAHKGLKHNKTTRKKMSLNSRTYIDGRTNKKYYCIDCENKINWQTWWHGEKRCKSCSNSGKNNPSYIDGLSKFPYPLEWTETLKESIRQRDNYKCQLCGCPEIECNQKLDVHHIDYNKENLDPNNLISLCRQCNIKANFSRDYWYVYFTYIMETIEK